MRKYVITKEEYRAVQQIKQSPHNHAIDDKLDIILMRYEGMAYLDIANALGCSRSSVGKAVRDFKTHGLQEFIRDRRVRFLSQMEEDALLCTLLSGSPVRELPERTVREAFEARIGQKVSTNYVYDLMRRHHIAVRRANRADK